jgi:4-cresol dehydrogenase (hydroxylating)
LKKYPYEDAKGITPLPKMIRDKVSDEYGLADWTASGAFYGTKERVEADKTVLRKRVAALGTKPMFIDDAKLRSIVSLSTFLTTQKIGKQVARMLGAISNRAKVQLKKLNMIEDLVALYHLKKGKPTNHFVKTTFWRTREATNNDADSADPNDGSTGFIWIAPCTPISADRVNALVSIVNRVTDTFGFEPALSITLLNERAAECVISISFDRTNHEEETRAMRCHQQILEESAKCGCYVYRLSSESNNTDLSAYLEQNYERLDLKELFDPYNIVAAGKYRNIYVSK